MSSTAEDIWVIGNEWLKEGNYQQAIREFMMAVKTDPKHFKLWKGMGLAPLVCLREVVYIIVR
jgi:hypothetical protein